MQLVRKEQNKVQQRGGADQSAAEEEAEHSTAEQSAAEQCAAEQQGADQIATVGGESELAQMGADREAHLHPVR